MIGTSGAEFDVVFENAVGSVGIRNIENGQYRVRVEPKEGLKFPDLETGTWKTPSDGQNRYSNVVSIDELSSTVTEAKEALDNSVATLEETAAVSVTLDLIYSTLKGIESYLHANI